MDAATKMKSLKKGDVVDLPKMINAPDSPPMQIRVDSISEKGVINCTIMIAGIKMMALAAKVDEGKLTWVPN